MGHETILVVDDDSLVCNVVSRILQHDGYEVWEAGAVASAIEVAARKTGPIDLLICDVLLQDSRMREESCALLVAHLRKQFPLLKVLLISGLPMDILTENNLLPATMLEEDNVFHRQKPFSRNELLDEVDRILHPATNGSGGRGKGIKLMSHITEYRLDEYVTGTLEEPCLAEVEEHLLACRQCQVRLELADDFAALFREAVQPAGQPAKASWQERLHLWLMWRPALVWAAAAAAVILAVAVPARLHQAAPATVLLQSLRGPESAVLVQSGKPLKLLVDVPATEVGRVEIVDLSGKRIAELAPQIRDGQATVLASGLARGAYWVRVYGKTGTELLAEYSVTAK